MKKKLSPKYVGTLYVWQFVVYDVLWNGIKTKLFHNDNNFHKHLNTVGMRLKKKKKIFIRVFSEIIIISPVIFSFGKKIIVKSLFSIAAFVKFKLAYLIFSQNKLYNHVWIIYYYYYMIRHPEIYWIIQQNHHYKRPHIENRKL